MSTQIMSSDNKHALHHTFYTPNINKEAPIDDKTPIDKEAPTNNVTDNPAIKATLLIVHGMAEHSRRYDEFAQFLADKGIAVLTYDHLGHGLTATPDEFGYFNDQYPMQTLLQDTVIMANAIKSRHADVPHFIMGHSMGSFIVRTVLQHHSQDFAGAIIMGTSDTDPLVNALTPIAKALNKVKPKMPNPVFGKATNFIANSRLKDKASNSEYAWLAKNTKAVEDYENDPLCGFDFTNNGYLGLFKLMRQGLAKDWAQTIKPDFPLLFISGEDDPIGNMGKGIRTLVRRMRQQQGFKNIDMQLYSDMRHEPLHEAYPEPVYHDILAWILAHV